MVGSFAGCCARAASGHATAVPPAAAMNSRRLMPAMGTFSARIPRPAGHWGRWGSIRLERIPRVAQ